MSQSDCSQYVDKEMFRQTIKDNHKFNINNGLMSLPDDVLIKIIQNLETSDPLGVSQANFTMASTNAQRIVQHIRNDMKHVDFLPELVQKQFTNIKYIYKSKEQGLIDLFLNEIASGISSGSFEFTYMIHFKRSGKPNWLYFIPITIHYTLQNKTNVLLTCDRVNDSTLKASINIPGVCNTNINRFQEALVSFYKFIAKHLATVVKCNNEYILHHNQNYYKIKSIVCDNVDEGIFPTNESEYFSMYVFLTYRFSGYTANDNTLPVHMYDINGNKQQIPHTLSEFIIEHVIETKTRNDPIKSIPLYAFGNSVDGFLFKYTCKQNPVQHGKPTFKLVEKRKVLGKQRNIYRSGRKLFIKIQNNFIGLTEYLATKKTI